VAYLGSWTGCYAIAVRFALIVVFENNCVCHLKHGVVIALQGDVLSPEEWAAVEEMGILVDQDDQGVLLQIFTKPLGDRWGSNLRPAVYGR
jgi:hypothetical protein